MKQVLIEKGNVIVDEVPSRVCGARQILVANRYSLISWGTEFLHRREREQLD